MQGGYISVNDQIRNLTDKHKGAVCYIIGKGPSLKDIGSYKFKDDGIIIAINESIVILEKLNLPNKLYSIQQDGRQQCMRKPKNPETTLLLSKPFSGDYFPEHPNRIVYRQVEDLHVMDRIFTAISAISFAKIFGCAEIVFLGFDACTDCDASYAKGLTTYVDPSNNLGRFLRFCEIIKFSVGHTIKARFYSLKTKCNYPINVGNFTVITCTGDRFDTFKLCRKWILNQTILPTQWIVIDDGKSKLPWAHKSGSDYYYRSPSSNDPKHTLLMNLAIALKKVTTDKVIIVEDDDWYHPQYLEKLNHWLDFDRKLIGVGKTVYYHLPSQQYKRFNNIDYTCFACTAFHSTVIPEVMELCNTLGTPLIDMTLWKLLKNEGTIYVDEPPLYVGMKGMPGRAGQTSGHRTSCFGYIKDVNFEYLQSIVGDDIAHYSRICK